MTQSVLAGLVRRSERWLIDVEQDRVDLRLSDIESLAAALRTDVAGLLTGSASSPAPADPAVDPALRGPATPALQVEVEDAGLRYRDGVYHLTVRREILNTSHQPLRRYLVRIAVDRYPRDLERSRQHYRENPLTWEELNFTARREGEEMAFTVKEDQDSFKEMYLRFESPDGRSLALPPGESTWIDYTYSVGQDKWGPFFVRAVRWPTRHLRVQLSFPRVLNPLVWGSEISVSGDSADLPLTTQSIRRQDLGDERIFEWETTSPPLHNRYRLEWRLFGGLA
jgi:hypothetical protein